MRRLLGNVQSGKQRSSGGGHMKLGGKSNVVSGSPARARQADMNNQSDTGHTGYIRYKGYKGYKEYNVSTRSYVNIENMRLGSERGSGLEKS